MAGTDLARKAINMLRTALILSSVFLVVSCSETNQTAAFQEITMTPGIEQEMSETIAVYTRNPQTTTFRNMRMITKAYVGGNASVVVCGWINAENAFGGFNGYAPFRYETYTQIQNQNASTDQARQFPLIIGGQTYNYLGINVTVPAQQIGQDCANDGIPI
jgi:hypothetical protein